MEPPAVAKRKVAPPQVNNPMQPPSIVQLKVAPPRPVVAQPVKKWKNPAAVAQRQVITPPQVNNQKEEIDAAPQINKIND